MIKGQSSRDRSAFMTGGQARRAFLAVTAGLLSAGKTSSSEAGILPTAETSIRWLAFYGVTAEEAILATYDIVVLDPAFPGSISLVAGSATRGGGCPSPADIT